MLINEHRTANNETVILHTDVTEMKEREAELARSNRELQDFASVASHDLQEPLRKIEAFGDQLRRKYGPQLDETGRFYVERMEKAAKRMRALIEGLLTFSRISTKAQPFAACDLGNVIDGVLSDLRVRIRETEGTIDLQPLPGIEADAMQMRQLFQNLIGNALKFRQPGPAASRHDQSQEYSRAVPRPARWTRALPATFAKFMSPTMASAST